MGSPGQRVLPLVLTPILSRPFKVVGGSEGKPLVEVESGEKTVRYVSVHLCSLIFLGLTSAIHSLLKNSHQ